MAKKKVAGKKAGSLELEHRVQLGTDGASFLIYHPDDFPDNPARPAECLDHDFAWNKEVGKVIGFCTGSDGRFTFRITGGPLTAAEKKNVRCSAVFRYTVRHGEVLLDNGCGYDQFQFDVPNGDYRATLDAIDWEADEAAKLPSYVLRFEPVADLAEVDPTPWPPRMDGDVPTPFCSITEAEVEEEGPQEAMEEEYRLIVKPGVLLVPGDDDSFEFTDDFYERLRENRTRRFIVAPSEKVSSLGSIADRCSAGKVGNGPWSVGLRGEYLVTLTKIRKHDGDTFAKFKLLTRSGSKPKPDAVAKMKSAFAAYYATKPKGVYLRDPKFELEQFAESRSPQKEVWWLLAKLPLGSEEKARVAVLSLAEQVTALHAWLTAPERQRDRKTYRQPTDRDREFLQAIANNPSDDAPRLAYADWLTQQGDPRGEFIRIQCERARVDFNEPKWDELISIEREIEKEHGEEWKKDHEKLGIEGNFQRGFITSASLSAKKVLAQAKKLQELLPPLASLTVSPFDPKTRLEQFEKLAACPVLATLRRLQLSSNAVTDAEVALLADSPLLKELRELCIVGSEIGPAGAQAIADSLHLGNLVELLLPSCPLTAAGAIALAKSQTLRNLRRLALGYTNIGDKGISALAKSAVVDGVTNLDVCWNGWNQPKTASISAKGLEALTGSPHFANLESLSLGGNPFGDDGASVLAKSKTLRKLKYLDLTDCGISHVGAKAIATSKGLESLESLRLGGTKNKIDARVADAVIKSKTLKGVNFFMNGDFSDAVAKRLRDRFGDGVQGIRD